MFVYSCPVLPSLVKTFRVLSSLYITFLLQCCLMFFNHDFTLFLGRFWDQILKGASGFFDHFPTWRPWVTLGCSQDASRPSQDVPWTRSRRPRDPPRRPKTLPRRALDEVKTPKRHPKTSLDTPRRRLGRPRTRQTVPKGSQDEAKRLQEAWRRSQDVLRPLQRFTRHSQA